MKRLVMMILIMIIYNIYFIFLLPTYHYIYLIYIDGLLLLGIVIYESYQYILERNLKKRINSLLKNDYLIYQDIKLDHLDVIEHDIQILSKQLQMQREEIYDLQDYIGQWFHEMKVPLSTLLLMIDGMDDIILKENMKEAAKRLDQRLNMALFATKLQSQLYDIQIQRTSLLKCIRQSITNHQYFLVLHHFQLQINGADVMIYTDPQWLTYVFDQLISNAIKYANEDPQLIFKIDQDQKGISVMIEDHGEGILESDIRHIFDKGFTGRNLHNGQYKSTGMGLYFAKMILDQLHHPIEVESQYGQYTRFTLWFYDHRDYFLHEM